MHGKTSSRLKTLSLFAIILGSLFTVFRISRRSQPVISVPESAIDLGDANLDEILRGSFVIQNNGSASLDFNLIKS